MYQLCLDKVGNDKGLSNQSYGFSSSHIWMWEVYHKESLAQKTDAFELWCWRRLKSHLDCKEIQSVHPKGNQSWIFIGRTDAEAEAPTIWPPDAKKWLTGKDPDAGKDWRHMKKGMTEDEMLGWHHLLNGYELDQAWEWWWKGNPGVLQSMGLQRVGNDRATELNWSLEIILMNFCS